MHNPDDDLTDLKRITTRTPPKISSGLNVQEIPSQIDMSNLLTLAEQQVECKNQTYDQLINYGRLKREIVGLIFRAAGGWKTYTEITNKVYEQPYVNSITAAFATAVFLTVGLHQLWAAITNKDATNNLAAAKAIQNDLQKFNESMIPKL